jgi:hypothetical protein
MPQGNRFLVIVAMGCMLAMLCASVLSFFFLSKNLNERNPIRSAIATASLRRAQRAWQGGDSIGAIREHVIAYWMVAESSVRLGLGDYYYSQATGYLNSGDYADAFVACSKAVQTMGDYEVEVGISYNCPGMRTKALLQTQ